MPSSLDIKVGARSSRLSRIQVDEVHHALCKIYPHVKFIPTWIETTGDKDLQTSLKNLEKSSFFTEEIDTGILQGNFRIGIHSAKDLPDPLPPGLKLICLTKGLDPSDVIVYNSPSFLKQGGRVGTSSYRRDVAVTQMNTLFEPVDIRGTIEHRLEQLDRGDFEAVVMAEAALIRLGLHHRLRIKLECELSPFQGQLAVVARADDGDMEKLFQCLDSRISQESVHE